MIDQWNQCTLYLAKNVKSVWKIVSDIIRTKDNDSGDQSRVDVTMVVLVIIAQPWSANIMEVFSYPTVINCCSLWLDCLLGLKLKSTYCAATSDHQSALPVCLCFTLCECAPCWSSFTLWTASTRSGGLGRETQAITKAPTSLVGLAVNKCPS